jgi:hypothetical protein
LVCTQKYNVIPILAKCLVWNIGDNTISNDDNNDETRRMACLILNQLSLPFQNKKVMVFGSNGSGQVTGEVYGHGSVNNGHESDVLIENLVHVIKLRLPETYLCCICLMNLTYLESTVEPILNNMSTRQMCLDDNFPRIKRTRSASKRPNNIDPKEWNNFPSASRVPAIRAPSPAKGYHIRSSSSSISCSVGVDGKLLLRSIETLMQEHRPFLVSKVLSVEGEAIRWSVGLMRNLTKKEEHCAIIGKTEIPCLILSFVRQSPHPIIRWTKDSIEVMSLTVLENMAAFEDTRFVLKTWNAIEVIRQLDEERERLGLSLKTAPILASLNK